MSLKQLDMFGGQITGVPRKGGVQRGGNLSIAGAIVIRVPKARPRPQPRCEAQSRPITPAEAVAALMVLRKSQMSMGKYYLEERRKKLEAGDSALYFEEQLIECSHAVAALDMATRALTKRPR